MAPEEPADDNSGRLLILAHGGTWEQRFQISSLASSEASAGRPVDIALFFAALHCWVRNGWDTIDPTPPLDPARVERQALPTLSSFLEPGRKDGLVRLYACSASVRLLGLDPAETQDRVEAILGWQSFSRMIRRASQVVTL